MQVDINIVIKVLKELKQNDFIDGYWHIKDALQNECGLTQAQADNLFGQATNTGDLA